MAGHVTATASAAPPSRSATTATNHRTNTDVNPSAENGDPPNNTGVGSPNRRLNPRANRPGSPTPRRAAASPTTNDPSSRKNNNDGTTAA